MAKQPTPQKALAEIFKALAPITSADPTRRAMQCVRVTVDGPKHVFDATNGHILVRIVVDRVAFVDDAPAPGLYGPDVAAKTLALGMVPAIDPCTDRSTFPPVDDMIKCGTETAPVADPVGVDPARVIDAAKAHMQIVHALTGSRNARETAFRLTTCGIQNAIKIETPRPLFAALGGSFTVLALVMPYRLERTPK